MAFQYQGNYAGQHQSGANPFRVVPGNNMQAGLQGIGRSMGALGEQMKERKAKQRAEATYTDIRTRMEAAQSMSPGDKANEYAALHRDYGRLYGGWLEGLMNVHTDATGKQPHVEFGRIALRDAYVDPDNAPEHIARGVERIEAAGGDATHLRNLGDDYRRNPELARQNAGPTLSLMAPKHYDALPPIQKGVVGKVNPDDWTPRSLAEYAKSGDYGVLEASVKPPSEMSLLTQAIAGQALSDKQQAAHTRRSEQAITTKAAQTEADNRATLETRLPELYGNASPKEMTELVNVVRSSPNAATGRTNAEATRGRQRKDKKAAGLTAKSIDLLVSILENPELDDVVGAREGKPGGWLNKIHSGPEGDAAADIRELVDLLTVPNLEIITGPMSDSDIAMVGRVAGGGLDRMRSDETFRKRATQLIGALGVPTIPPNDKAAHAALKSGDHYITDGKLYRKR